MRLAERRGVEDTWEGGGVGGHALGGKGSDHSDSVRRINEFLKLLALRGGVAPLSY
jgi:hypothetical protein